MTAPMPTTRECARCLWWEGTAHDAAADRAARCDLLRRQMHASEVCSRFHADTTQQAAA